MAMGGFGISVDQAKCVALLREAAGLGSLFAQCQLGNFHYEGEKGLEQNEKEATIWWEKAAEGGDMSARFHLGNKEQISGDFVAAMRHFRLCASGGFRKAMEILMEYFEAGFLHHADLAETMRFMYLARSELKSVDRDKFVEYLKRTGRHRAGIDV